MPTNNIILTEAQINTIIYATTEENPLGGLNQVWFYILGKPINEFPAGTINASDYRLPRNQYEQIIRGSMEKVSKKARDTIKLYWDNLGPAVIT